MLIEATRTERKLEDFGKDQGDGFGRFNGKRLAEAAWRQKYALIATIVAALALGVAYLMQAIPGYTAMTSILIDSRKAGVISLSQLESALSFETGVVDSQVQILLSDKLAGIVADRLALPDNAAFMNPPRSPLEKGFGKVVSGIDTAVRWATGQPQAAAADQSLEVRRIIAVTRLKSNLRVTRVGRTYVLVIEFTSDDRGLARDIASTYAQAFIADQIDSRVDIARNASAWMEGRIRDLRGKADLAEQAVQTFKVRNNLTEASGRLINEQSLTDAIAQLSNARAEQNSVRAKYERLKQIIDARDYSASMLETFSNSVVIQLRTKYLQASKQNADITAKVGPDHYQADAARKEMAEYSRLIFDELSRLMQSYQSELQIAADRVATQERAIERMRTVNATDSDAQSRLKSMEHEAATYNALYTNMLQKFQEAVQQQSYPVIDVGVLTEASLPMEPSAPRALIILTIALVAGILIGMGIAAWREFADAGFRTAQQVREWLGLDFISYLPRLPKKALRIRRHKPPRGDSAATARVVRPLQDSLDYVQSAPLSPYAEAVRALKVSLDVKTNLRRPAILGFVSMLPNEGKSTTAKNFASLVAAQGERVLLIDADLRNPQLTRTLTPDARHGLVDLIGKTHTLDNLVHTEPKSSLSFLPGATHRRFDASGDLLGSRGMADFLRQVSDKYDVVVIDLPPAGVLVDTAAMTHLIDWFFLVAEWGKTRRDLVRDHLVADPLLTEKIIGVALTKVDTKRLRAFGVYDAYGHSHGAYRARYYGPHAA